MFGGDSYHQFFFKVPGKMTIKLLDLSFLLKGTLYLHYL